MAPKTFREFLELTKTGDGEYLSKHTPERMGNMAPIGYGGCTLALALAAADRTVGGQYFLYSAQGNYLGAASTERPLIVRVRRIRDTKTFATRQIEVLQEQAKPGDVRACLLMTADFHIKEPRSALVFSAAPALRFSAPEASPEMYALLEQGVRDGVVAPAALATHRQLFALMARYFDQKLPPEGFTEQTLHGWAMQLATTQDALSNADKTSGDWFRNKVPLATRGEHAAALAFEMDGKISFVPALNERKLLPEFGACSSLDFSLRLFTADLDLNDWHLRQFKTFAAGGARTFSEAKLWDSKGNIVASMSQQSILRPKPESKPKPKSSL